MSALSAHSAVRVLSSRLRKIINQTPNSVFQHRHIEIHEKAHLAPGKPEVREQLSLMDWRQRIHGFDFNNHSPFDEQVQSVTAVQLHVFVYDRQRSLLLDPQSALRELEGQARLVR